MRFWGWLLVAIGCLFGWDGLNRLAGLSELAGNPFSALAESLVILTLGVAATALFSGFGLLAAGKHKHLGSGFPEGYKSGSSRVKRKADLAAPPPSAPLPPPPPISPASPE